MLFRSPAQIARDSTPKVFVDCDLPPAYGRFHLPGAHLAPCRYWKAGGSDEGLYAIEDHERFAALIGGFGINEEVLVVAYDGAGGLNAARFCWTLERFGFHHFCILDGGPAGWLEAGLPLTQESPPARPSSFPFRECDWTNCARLEDIEKVVHEGGGLWDDRSLEEWEGGNIPGAMHLHWTETLGAGGRLLERNELKRKIDAFGWNRDTPIIVYCQGGIRAAHGYFVLRELGYLRVRVYDGSWAEYSTTQLPTG